MNRQILQKTRVRAAQGFIALSLLAASAAFAGDHERSTFVLTSSNDPSSNAVVIFKLDTGNAPALSHVETLPTGGTGGASGNAGIVQFEEDLGAVANFGSNTVTRLQREGDYIRTAGTIELAPNCNKPDSVAIAGRHLFIVGANCAESHDWPGGHVDGTTVRLTDPSSAQIAVGTTWAAVTQTSGALLRLSLATSGALSGVSSPTTLPTNANNTPLGEAFWGDRLGFTPAHSPDSFVIVDKTGDTFPIAGPTPAYPTNAPCWVAKGPGNLWYTGNSPGQAISIFFSDGAGGVFYKSLPLPGAPTDISVSPDRKWLAVIFTQGGQGFVAVYAIDRHGDLSMAATSPAVGVSSFGGVAFSQ